MKLTLLIFLFFLINSIFASQTQRLEVNTLSFTDGGKTYHKKNNRQKKSRRIDKTTFAFFGINKISKINEAKKRTKGGAILMTVLTGPIGGHRLYLGCDPYIPIFYALTLGGGLGVLPAIDIIVIAVSKDLSSYENNSSILMWGNKLMGSN